MLLVGLLFCSTTSLVLAFVAFPFAFGISSHALAAIFSSLFSFLLRLLVLIGPTPLLALLHASGRLGLV